MSLEQLAATATQTNADYRAALVAILTKTPVFTNGIAQLAARDAAILDLTNRLEAAVLAGGGGNVSTTFAYLSFAGADENLRPETWANSAPGGSIYYNRGSGNTVGGRGDPYGPYGAACYTESAANAPVAIVSAEKYSIAGPMTLHNFSRLGPGDGYIMSFSDSGLDSQPLHLGVVSRPVQTQGKRSFTMKVKAFGEEENIDTIEVPDGIYNGQNCDDVIFQRDDDNHFSLRAQGVFLARTVNAYPGVLTGYWAAFGNYQQDGGAAESVYRSSVGFARGDRAALFSGSTYTVSPTLPAL